MTLTVPLESILPCFQGVLPSLIATCSTDGVPNVTYLSIVHYVDAERIALSRQFLNKTWENIRANPQAQIRVVHPENGAEFVLDLAYLHSDTEGPIFDDLRVHLEAIASQSGMGEVFRLRGADVYRVVRCEAAADQSPVPAGPAPGPDVLAAIDVYVRRLAACTAMDELIRVALQSLEDIFDFPHSILMFTDGPDRLFAVASNGYPTSGAGAEVVVGQGAIGIAAARRRVIRMASLYRNRAMTSALRSAVEGAGGTLASTEIPLPGAADAQSLAAVPMQVHGRLIGVLYLDSELPGRFGAREEQLLQILCGHLATTIAAIENLESRAEPAVPTVAPTPAQGPVVEIRFYDEDGSVFLDDAYLVKGVPGRILWKMLCERRDLGRISFTNKELRHDRALELPRGADNLDARLLVLRKRLEERAPMLRLERSGRGRLDLVVEASVKLVDASTAE